MKRIILILGILLLAASVGGELMLTRDQLVTAAQRQVNFDESKSDSLEVPDTVWSEFVNRACVRVATDLDCNEKQTLIVTASGTWAYIIDAAILEIQWVVKTASRTMVPLRSIPPAYLEDFYRDTTSAYEGSPSAYWMQGDSIIFYPTPVQADSFLVGYSIYPEHLDSANDSTDIPIQYRDGIMLFSVYLFKSRVEKYEDAQWWKTEYDKVIIDYRAKKINRFHAPPAE